MPLYEFRCDQCGEQFEKFVRKMDMPAPICPHCGEETEQTISKPSQFVWGNGGGWY